MKVKFSLIVYCFDWTVPTVVGNITQSATTTTTNPTASQRNTINTGNDDIEFQSEAHSVHLWIHSLFSNTVNKYEIELSESTI